ncbi:hypothetical protein NDU88_005252 [Pleurodeles waltl]|uniref:Uncharacterized protein n=1 Tax=Pleurodeles waltl TaxID=8319 RepID=A0AAV7RLQ5_PLEWA|nr:hypothetical protein NDU88_005252 [Pleurodeles waltl]
MATDLQDTAVVARIASGDVVAIGGMYHLNFLTIFWNRHQSLMRKRKTTEVGEIKGKKIEAQAFIELINFIENSVEQDVFCFKLFELHHKYADNLVALGVQKKVNKVHLKEKVLGCFPQDQVQSDGKHVVLVFDQGMKQSINRQD